MKKLKFILCLMVLYASQSYGSTPEEDLEYWRTLAQTQQEKIDNLENAIADQNALLNLSARSAFDEVYAPLQEVYWPNYKIALIPFLQNKFIIWPSLLSREIVYFQES